MTAFLTGAMTERCTGRSYRKGLSEQSVARFGIIILMADLCRKCEMEK